MIKKRRFVVLVVVVFVVLVFVRRKQSKVLGDNAIGCLVTRTGDENVIYRASIGTGDYDWDWDWAGTGTKKSYLEGGSRGGIGLLGLISIVGLSFNATVCCRLPIP